MIHKYIFISKISIELLITITYCELLNTFLDRNSHRFVIHFVQTVTLYYALSTSQR